MKDLPAHAVSGYLYSGVSRRSKPNNVTIEYRPTAASQAKAVIIWEGGNAGKLV
jgi:hypothetical protein